MARLRLSPRTPRPAAALPSAGSRRRRWAVGGALLGSTLALLSQWPAAWLAQGVQQASQGRVQLAEAQGTLWQGSALLVLTGGEGSRDATVLPARLHWRLAPAWDGLQLTLQQAGHLPQPLTLQAGWGLRSLALLPPAGPDTTPLAQWPAAWLQGLGAPWNTLKPAGQLRLLSRGLQWQRGEQGWQLLGQADLEALGASSSLSPLQPLGSYRLSLQGQAGQSVRLQLRTLDGPLQLQGQGELKPQGGLRFRGEASAAAEQAPALNNLLNIIGRRQGAASVFSIG